MNSYPRSAAAEMLPPRVAWDFDHEGCPADELDHCYLYEYALENPKMVELVILYRKNRDRLLRPEDELSNMTIAHWFGSSFSFLSQFEDFPRKHWLQIEHGFRKRQMTRLSLGSRTLSPIGARKYHGPTRADLNGLAGARLEWHQLKENTDMLEAQVWNCRRKKLPPRWPNSGRYLSQTEKSQLLRMLSLVWRGITDPNVQRTVESIKKRIAQTHRRENELIVYELDWKLRDGELVKIFREWLKVNRVHAPRKRGGGHTTTAAEHLRQLGAMRLLRYFRQQPEQLPKLKELTLYAALSDYTVEQRKLAGRPEKPLYGAPKLWREAQKLAKKHIRELLH